MAEIDDMLRFGEAAEGVDWGGLVRVIAGLQDFFGAAMVHKTNFVANFAPGFLRHMPMPLLVYIERDPVAVAQSILEARKAYYGDVARWWATYPPSYPAIATLPFAQQIAHQVADLRATYASVIAAAGDDRVLRFSYEALCRAPGEVLDAICERVGILYGTGIGRANPAPPRFAEAQPRQAPTPEHAAVVAALAALQVTS
jgi:hypothetical protein